MVIGTTLPMALMNSAVPLAAAAASGAVVGPALEALQVAQRLVAHHDHVSPARTVAAVGAAAGHMRFTAEAHAAVATGARLNVNLRAIVQHVQPS